MIKTPKPSFDEEQILWDTGYDFVIGIDEVGRGSFAGPVVVAAVVFRKNFDKRLKSDSSLAQLFAKIRDSKMLSPKQREFLTPFIKKNAHVFSIQKTNVRLINKVGIGKATQKAMRKAIYRVREKLHSTSVFVLVDGFHIKYVKKLGLKNQKAIVKGDQTSVSIASASIIAKVYRDDLMRRLHKTFPQYGFDKHKGYGTKMHQEAIKRIGLSPLHRTSFNLLRFLKV
ncbi:MAG: ribonuclease HII [Candidatus Levybacteria bacterium RIFCSPLOWO2_01_FULL_42_15]|nr:MAG: ribonuclease HII [Candidatus Levybacteria bacterium RIFCSPLOWO2_01_FULL_42_15]